MAVNNVSFVRAELVQTENLDGKGFLLSGQVSLPDGIALEEGASYIVTASEDGVFVSLDSKMDAKEGVLKQNIKEACGEINLSSSSCTFSTSRFIAQFIKSDTDRNEYVIYSRYLKRKFKDKYPYLMVMVENGEILDSIELKENGLEMFDALDMALFPLWSDFSQSITNSKITLDFVHSEGRSIYRKIIDNFLSDYSEYPNINIPQICREQGVKEILTNLDSNALHLMKGLDEMACPYFIIGVRTKEADYLKIKNLIEDIMLGEQN